MTFYCLRCKRPPHLAVKDSIWCRRHGGRRGSLFKATYPGWQGAPGPKISIAKALYALKRDLFPQGAK